MNAATLEKMRKMKLGGMYRVFKANLEAEDKTTYTPDEHTRPPGGRRVGRPAEPGH